MEIIERFQLPIVTLPIVRTRQSLEKDLRVSCDQYRHLLYRNHRYKEEQRLLFGRMSATVKVSFEGKERTRVPSLVQSTSLVACGIFQMAPLRACAFRGRLPPLGSSLTASIAPLVAINIVKHLDNVTLVLYNYTPVCRELWGNFIVRLITTDKISSVSNKSCAVFCIAMILPRCHVCPLLCGLDPTLSLTLKTYYQ